MNRSKKTVWLPMLLTAAIMSLAAACSTDDSDAYGDKAGSIAGAMEEGGVAIYEGEWTVNHQVVDTARLVVKGSVLQLRLPEEYLLSTYILPCLTDKNGVYELDNIPVEIQVVPQGFSEMSQYMSLASGTVQSNDALRWYAPCSFMALGSTGNKPRGDCALGLCLLPISPKRDIYIPVGSIIPGSKHRVRVSHGWVSFLGIAWHAARFDCCSFWYSAITLGKAHNVPFLPLYSMACIMRLEIARSTSAVESFRPIGFVNGSSLYLCLSTASLTSFTAKPLVIGRVKVLKTCSTIGISSFGGGGGFFLGLAPLD